MTTQSEPFRPSTTRLRALLRPIWAAPGWRSASSFACAAVPRRGHPVRIAAAILFVVAILQKAHCAKPPRVARHLDTRHHHDGAALRTSILGRGNTLRPQSPQSLYSSLPLCGRPSHAHDDRQARAARRIYSMLNRDRRHRHTVPSGPPCLDSHTVLGGTAFSSPVAPVRSRRSSRKQETRTFILSLVGLQLIIGSAFSPQQAFLWKRMSLALDTRLHRCVVFLANIRIGIAFACSTGCCDTCTPPAFDDQPGSAVSSHCGRRAYLQEFITPHDLVAAVVVLGAVGFVLRAESDEPAQLNLSRPARPKAK